MQTFHSIANIQNNILEASEVINQRNIKTESSQKKVRPLSFWCTLLTLNFSNPSQVIKQIITTGIENIDSKRDSTENEIEIIDQVILGEETATKEETAT